MFGLLLFCTGYYITAGISVVIGYHRGLTHKAFKLNKTLERILVTLALPAGTPVQWVGNHRAHHQHSDTNLDPHSPVVSGFWYAHNGWLIDSSNPFICSLYALAGPFRFLIDAWNRPRTNQQHVHLANDIAQDAYYRLLSMHYVYLTILLFHIIIPFGFVYSLWQWTGIIALWATLVLIFNAGDSVDSFAHLYGDKPYKNESGARNNKTLALLTFGDGWHADHHQFPRSAKLGFHNNLDVSWHIILFLQKLGLASELQKPSAEQIKSQLKQ